MLRPWHVLLALIVLFLLSRAGLWTAGRLSPDYTLDLGGAEWGRIQNANDWEFHGSYTYRWTRDVTRFRLPHLGTPRMVTVRLDGTRPEGFPPAVVTLSLDGRDVASFVPPAGPYQVVYDGPDAWRWETVLEVRTTPFSPPDAPRKLGVIVDRVHFSAPLRPPAPPWVLVVLWVAVGIAAAVLGHLLAWAAVWRSIFPVALVVGLIALFGGDRPAALPWAGVALAVLGAGAVVAWAFRVKGDRSVAEEDTSGGPLRQDGRLGSFALVCTLLAGFFFTRAVPRGARRNTPLSCSFRPVSTR
jgi:hypothetical protein